MSAELKFLRYFFEEAKDYMGPADLDIYQSIAESYKGPIPDIDSCCGYLFYNE